MSLINSNSSIKSVVFTYIFTQIWMSVDFMVSISFMAHFFDAYHSLIAYKKEKNDRDSTVKDSPIPMSKQ